MRPGSIVPPALSQAAKSPQPARPLDELMTCAEVASFIRIPSATLRYWRYIGIGPKSFKMGPRRVLYRREDVQDWVDAQYAEGG